MATKYKYIKPSTLRTPRHKNLVVLSSFYTIQGTTMEHMVVIVLQSRRYQQLLHCEHVCMLYGLISIMITHRNTLYRIFNCVLFWVGGVIVFG